LTAAAAAPVDGVKQVLPTHVMTFSSPYQCFC